MKKHSIAAAFVLLLTACANSLWAQGNPFYWYEKTRIELTLDKIQAGLYFKTPLTALPGAGKPLVKKVVFFPDGLGAQVQLASPWAGTLPELVTYLEVPAGQLSSATFGHKLSDGFQIVVTEQVVAYCEEAGGGNDPALLNTLKSMGLKIVSNDGRRLVVDTDNALTVLTVGNALYDLPQVRWAEPEMLAEITPHADPLYPDQYFLNNTGQVVDGAAGAVDADIDAPEAWAVTTGLPSVIVAVIDEGVDSHEDLKDWNNNSRVLWGYPNGGGPANSSHKHGLPCAGIVAASHNNLGGRGVAPGVKILPVNVFSGSGTTWVSTCINWAWQNGAHVLSNSWGYNSCTFGSNDITQAITNARTLGRGGRGCVVVFSAGNSYASCVNYPAKVSGVMSVAALTKYGTRSNYSSYGSGLGVSAFGGSASGDIRTTDRMGAPGYTSGNYMNTFNGTSAACPQVSGVAALLLSVAPTWTESEVRCRIQEAATDIGTAGYDTDFGAGRLNAYYAVAIHNLDLVDKQVAGTQHYAADQHMTSGAGSTLQSTARMTLTAGRSVTLNPGFSTVSGAMFLGQISNAGPCGIGPRSNDDETESTDDTPIVAETPPTQTGTVEARIFPNPVSEDFTLRLSEPMAESATLILMDMSGRKLIEVTLEPEQTEVQVPMGQCPPGIYITQVMRRDTRLWTGKLVKL